MVLKIAYLINQYPKVSHSFVRREIAGLEACGIFVQRFSIRSCADELVDEADKLELDKTQFVLAGGAKGLIRGLLRVFLTRPGVFLKALKLAIRLGWGSEQGLLLHLAYLAEACILLQWFTQSNITHVHVHFGTNSATVALLCHALGGPPYSFTVHGPEEFDKAKGIALPTKIQNATFVIAVSSFGRSQLYRWCSPEQWFKVHVVHCGVDQTFLTQPPTPISDVPQLVCVGRLSEQKGHLLLVEAVKQLASEGLRFKLVFVGDGELRSLIEAQIAQFNLQPFIEITGWASNTEVREQILASRAMVLPSFAEGLPVVIMEALALRRPVISTYVAGIPELVEPGSCGWLIPAGSVEALAEAMRSALQSSIEELEQMGTAGAKRVTEQHDAWIEAQKLAVLFGATEQPAAEEAIAASR